MRFLIIYFAFFSLISCAGAKNNSESTTLDVIRNNFEHYKNDQQSPESDNLTDAVSQRTVSYFDNIMKIAISADSATINALMTQEKSYVLLARMIWTNDSISLHSGRELYSEITKRKMNFSPLVNKSVIAEIEMTNDTTAKGYLGSENKKLQAYFYFFKENGNWLIDPLSFSKSFFIPMDNVMILNYLKSRTKLAVPDNIWNTGKK